MPKFFFFQGKHHRSKQSKKSIIPKSPKIIQPSPQVSRNLPPWKEISKKSLIDDSNNAADDNEPTQKQKRGITDYYQPKYHSLSTVSETKIIVYMPELRSELKQSFAV